MKIIDKLAWIEIKDKAILSTKSFGKDKYYILGGKREHGETDAGSLCREIREELSVELNGKSLSFLGTFEAQAHGHITGSIVKMTCYTGSYTGTIKATSEIAEVKWLYYADIDVVSEVDKLIFAFLKERNLMV